VPPTADAPYARTWLGARFLLRPVGRLLLRPEVSGRARLPHEGGAVIAFNHVGFLDALLVTQVLARPTRFMVAAGVLRVPVIGRILRASGAFGVRRGERDRASLRVAIAAAAAGGLVGIFPEGGLELTPRWPARPAAPGRRVDRAACPGATRSRGDRGAPVVRAGGGAARTGR
jgi:1-acyl-sn-glycerol-3-phosphate acyltransferase